MLDVDHGTYPYVTSSTTTASGAAVGAGIGPTEIDGVLGVVKAYTTRVGNGPLPTEASGELEIRLRDLGGEFGATTGRPRRCGWFDAPVVRYSVRVNGLTGLAVTKLDVLDTFDTIPVATKYRVDGDTASEIPGDVDQLDGLSRYMNPAGWQRSTAKHERWPTSTQARAISTATDWLARRSDMSAWDEAGSDMRVSSESYL